MSPGATPQSLLQQQLAHLESQLPAVRDGSPAGIHEARIATRRVRELLPLAAEWHPGETIDALHQRFRRVGRALGEVRDADVRIKLLKRFESRVPTAAPALVIVRQAQERSRLQLMRKLIKQLERDELQDLIAEAATRRRWTSGWWRASGRRWRDELHGLVAERARNAEASVRHATGVYFPKRTHAARIAIKKLRYALEIAEATISARPTPAIRDLKKAQDLLGDVHDRQELIDTLGHTLASDDATANRIGFATGVMEAEIDDLHARYLARRNRIAEIVRDASHLRGAHSPARTSMIVAAGALAISSGLVAASRRRTNGESQPGHMARRSDVTDSTSPPDQGHPHGRRFQSHAVGVAGHGGRPV